ncbi:hypothetical protein ACM25N_10375 [Roseovarius sp. C7]|uniref:hypothetical protein n=1 Tax=Roseovarius sp. C7 TaxID=3398643 RepID=UPI0039F6ED39
MFTTRFHSTALSRLIPARQRVSRMAPAQSAAARCAAARFAPIDDTIDRLSTEVPGLVPANRQGADLAQAPFDVVAAEMKSQGWAWLLGAVLVMMALPVGLLVVLSYLVRGADPRLAAHAVALTGLFIALDTSPATSATLHLALDLLL